jgi:tRNA (cmo5U34)-methyltransferase
LAGIEDRVEYVQADLSNPNWVGGVAGPLDLILATRTIHHFGGAPRIRQLFDEIYGQLGHGGLFINLDYVRPIRPVWRELQGWAAEDAEAGFQTNSPHMELPSTAEEQLSWLQEAGFATSECVYREFQTAILVGDPRPRPLAGERRAFPCTWPPPLKDQG